MDQVLQNTNFALPVLKIMPCGFEAKLR